MKSYTELLRIPSFVARYEYLKLSKRIGEETFGYDRYLNQALYSSRRWRSVRDKVLIRDNGCDMAHPDYPIGYKVFVHHMNPISIEDIEDERGFVFDPEYLVCVSNSVHNAIHFGDSSLLPKEPVIRRPNDTCPWRRKEC